MRWRLGKSPYLRSISDDSDDLLILANSFEPRCLFAASTIVSSRYAAKSVLVVNYESSNPQHESVKAKHRLHFDQILSPIAKPVHIPTRKYDVIAFAEDIRRCLGEHRSLTRIVIDITTFTKCTLATLLSILRDRYPDAEIRCVWTPGIYSSKLEMTRGVGKTFAVPGLGGVGWNDCRVLVIFLGQEIDRSYSLWRAIDPDLLYLVASDSEYSSISAESVLASASIMSSLVETKSFIIDGVNPYHSESTLRFIDADLQGRGYSGEVAVASFGTKIQVLGVWSYLRDRSLRIGSWHYVYATPRLFVGNKYTRDYCRELNEVDMAYEGDYGAVQIPFGMHVV
jgi:hypothetical protein